MWECTYWNNLKISRCNERSSGRAREREREKVIIVWKEQEEEENRSNIMVFAMYNFANICLPFLLLQLLEQALRCWPTTCRKKIGFICILRMRSKVGVLGAPFASGLFVYCACVAKVGVLGAPFASGLFVYCACAAKVGVLGAPLAERKSGLLKLLLVF